MKFIKGDGEEIASFFIAFRDFEWLWSKGYMLVACGQDWVCTYILFGPRNATKKVDGSFGSIGNVSGDWILHWNILIISNNSAWTGKVDLHKGQNYIKEKNSDFEGVAT